MSVRFISAEWWLLRSRGAGYVSSATYATKKGLVLRFTADPDKALQLPTRGSARALRRSYHRPDAIVGDVGPRLVVVHLVRYVDRSRAPAS